MQFSGALKPQLSRSARVTAKMSRKMSMRQGEENQMTGVVFMPLQEAQSEFQIVERTSVPTGSIARSMFDVECEAKLNEQINIEYNVSYIYHALSAYFDRDTVHLPNIAKLFRESSIEERDHAQKMIDYQNMRGGRVKLTSINAPSQMEFDHSDKGDALYAFELALSLEKLNFHKLMDLTKLAESKGDNQFTDFLEGEFLKEQVESIRQFAGYVTTLRRVGKGHGVFHFDLSLEDEA